MVLPAFMRIFKSSKTEEDVAASKAVDQPGVTAANKPPGPYVTIFFVSGINTLLQTTIGDRLPIVQGGSFSFLSPAFSIIARIASTQTFSSDRERFLVTMRELQGGIIGSSFIVIFLGYSGAMGYLLQWISPIVVASVVTMVGLALYAAGFSGVANCYEQGFVAIICVIAFSQYLKHVAITLPGGHRLKLFELFPVMWSIICTWILAAILTKAGAYDDTSLQRTTYCRTDQTDILETSPWWYFPYPGQWGRPTFSAASVITMAAGALAAMIESVGDYYACARMAGAPVPPGYVIGRGVGAEGLGCLMAGLWGTGNGTTSYAENICLAKCVCSSIIAPLFDGQLLVLAPPASLPALLLCCLHGDMVTRPWSCSGAIGLTGVGSRRVVQTGACIMIMLAVIGKTGGLFAFVPAAILSGLFCCMFGLIVGVGVSNLQFTNQNSPRNLFILGFSVYMGLSVPQYFASVKGGVFKTSDIKFNAIFNTLCNTPMVISLLLSFILDNTIPGSREERGLHHWDAKPAPGAVERGPGGDSDDEDEHDPRDDPEIRAVYDLPFGVSDWAARHIDPRKRAVKRAIKRTFIRPVRNVLQRVGFRKATPPPLGLPSMSMEVAGDSTVHDPKAEAIKGATPNLQAHRV
ncbi:hypothetical protein QJQ45_015063 [Haematococcus lacustris]|nr:hypothetical protein QJQ45_015063 [Haematococcus lacustris]